MVLRIWVCALTGAQTSFQRMLELGVRLMVELLLDLQLDLFLGLADFWYGTLWDYFYIRSGLFCLAVR